VPSGFTNSAKAASCAFATCSSLVLPIARAVEIARLDGDLERVEHVVVERQRGLLL
jgi:hypothetical protein